MKSFQIFLQPDIYFNLMTAEELSSHLIQCGRHIKFYVIINL